MKVDLTKYVEQHTFIFDDVFDSDANNEEVRINIYSYKFKFKKISEKIGIKKVRDNEIYKSIIYLFIYLYVV